MTERPFKIYRYGDVGRTLYDTQCTKEAAKASAVTARREYRDQKIEVVDIRSPAIQIDEAFDEIAEAQERWVKSVPWAVSSQEKAAFVSGFLAGDLSRKERNQNG
jgi:hypothetical protein